jgi:hypothetical protein
VFFELLRVVHLICYLVSRATDAGSAPTAIAQEGSTSPQVTEAIAAQLCEWVCGGHAPAGIRACVTQTRAALAGRRCLVVVDDVWRVHPAFSLFSRAAAVLTVFAFLFCVALRDGT